MKSYLRLVFFFFFLLSFTALSWGAENKSTPRTIVHLLDYLAGDYAGAVKNGKIIDRSEHKEHLELIASACDMARDMEGVKDQKSIQEKILLVQTLIKGLAPAQKVAAVAQSVKEEIIKTSHLEIAPTEWPELKIGRLIFETNCAQCHGVNGHGNGILAAKLKPSPANFHDARLMATLTPFKIFNTAREGIPGTAMVPNPTLSDTDLWAVSFYVESLRHQWISDDDKANYFSKLEKKITLEEAANLSDDDISAKLPGTEKERKLAVAALRVHSSQIDPRDKTALASQLLLESLREYEKGNVKEAKQKALSAYLDGIEPIEPKIKARDPKLLVDVEKNMALVRGAMEENFTPDAVKLEITATLKTIKSVEQTIKEENLSPSLTFIMSASILLREAFEAVLVIIALLSVLRSTESKNAAHWVHAGWISAVAVGFVFWFFSGWLLQISGANRELLEGGISLAAVFILLYMGFWLHSKTEITRWNQFLKAQVQSVLKHGGLWGLALISFMSVAREALEVVLFLRTIWIESGAQSEMKSAMLGGIIFAFVVVLFLSWALVKYSARVPIRKLFAYTSSIMALLAFILMGKALHSIQEAGKISITLAPFEWRSDILGFYPTMETIAGQVLLIIVIYTLWSIGKKPNQIAS